MKRFKTSIIMSLALVTFLASCASIGEPTVIPAPPIVEEVQPMVTEPTTVAREVGKEQKTIEAVPTPQEEKIPEAEAKGEPAPAKNKMLEERIDKLSTRTTLDEAYALIADLSEAGADDGTLTRKAIAKAQTIAKELIDSALTQEELDLYRSLIVRASEAYGQIIAEMDVDLQAYLDLVTERSTAIAAYHKNSIYSYLKVYPKGHYTKELAYMLNKKSAK